MAQITDATPPDRPGEGGPRPAGGLTPDVRRDVRGRLLVGLLGGLAFAVMFGGSWAIGEFASGLHLIFVSMPLVACLTAVGVREVGGGIDRRFGILGAVLALADCLVLEVFSAWNAFVHQTRDATPERLSPVQIADLFSADSAARLTREHWHFSHLIAYALAAWLGYSFSFVHPGTPPTPPRRVPLGRQWKAFAVLGAAVVLVLGVKGLSASRVCVTGVSVSPDGRSLAVVQSGFDVPEVSLQDLDGRLQGSWRRGKGVAWAPDGKHFAILIAAPRPNNSPVLDEVVIRPRPGAGEYPRVEGPGRFTCLAFSPDGRTLATGGEDGGMRLWDVGRQARQAVLAHGAGVTALAFSPAGDRLAVGLADGTIVVWDTTTRQQISSWVAHRGGIDALVFRGRTLFSAAARDTAVRKWDPVDGRAGRPCTVAMDWLTGLALSPDGRTLAVAGGSFHRPGEVCLIDAEIGEVRQTFTVPENTVRTVAFTPDGRTLIAGTAAPISLFSRAWNGRVHRWDLATGRELSP